MSQRKIFISFLGTGPAGEGYDELDYCINGKPDDIIESEFVQAAEIHFIGATAFDKIFILCTKESYNANYHELRDELIDNIEVNDDIIEYKLIKNVNTPENQWKLFSEIYSLIEDEDELVFDLTHGFRSLSIILSTSLNFILNSKKNITLKHVFYGEKNSGENSHKGTIIDMKDFYIINEWADGIGRLVDNADATKLSKLAKSDTNTHFNNLNDKTMINSLERLTDTLKNIDVNRIADTTKEALVIVQKCLKNCDGAEKQLLQLVENKFKQLAMPSTGNYDENYYLLQIKIIKMLIEHKLFMQAFTSMRELIGSIGMLGAPDNYITDINNNGIAAIRVHYADLFVHMIEFSEKKIDEHNKGKETKEKRITVLRESIYKQIDKLGFLEEFKRITKKLVEIRNGFDHAWTGKGDKSLKKIGDIQETAKISIEFFEKLISRLIKENIIQ